MVKKDNQLFNNDDWLEKEIEREKRISAWDLDEGKELRQSHEENCDAREAANDHHVRHLRRSAYSAEKMERQMKGRVNGGDMMWLLIDIFAMIGLVFINVFLGDVSYLPAVLLFLSINPGIFIWVFLLKRMPSAAYLKIALLIAVLLELVLVIMPKWRYISFLLRRFFR